MIIQNRWLVPRSYSGITVWPFIFVVDTNDKALIEHEMVHYREMAWITPLWWAWYVLSKTFRVEAEVRAYKVQIKAGGLTDLQAAAWLLTYDSSLTPEEALKKLRS